MYSLVRNTAVPLCHGGVFVRRSSRLFSVFLATLDLKAFDVKALRAFRVLRPLKLVSGVPSTYRCALLCIVSSLHARTCIHRTLYLSCTRPDKLLSVVSLL